MKNITERLNQLGSRLRLLENRYQRTPDSVRVLAVSKTRPVTDIQAAIAAGQKIFGENYLQEAVGKITTLAESDIEWHFIGPVQSNKTRTLADHFHWCHSLDRIKIARRLSDAADPARPLNVCVQVNSSGEATKSGVDEDEAQDLCDRIAALPGLRLRGLMTMPAPSTDLQDQRQPFRRLRLLFDHLRENGHALDTLSMGTSHDIEAAVAEGATIIRIGTAIFGSRSG